MPSGYLFSDILCKMMRVIIVLPLLCQLLVTCQGKVFKPNVDEQEEPSEMAPESVVKASAPDEYAPAFHRREEAIPQTGLKSLEHANVHLRQHPATVQVKVQTGMKRRFPSYGSVAPQGPTTATCSKPSTLTKFPGSFGTKASHYENFEKCWWRIQAPGNQRIRLHFYSFYLEYGSRDCPYDYVKVHDGNDANAPVVGKFCGINVPGDIMTSRNTAFVSFTSDVSITRSGFMIRYSRVSCNKLSYVNGKSGGFGTVGSSYANYESCSWRIQVPRGKRVRLQFMRFNLEYGNQLCPYDEVKIFDRNSVYATLKGTYCGTSFPGDFTSSSNVVFVSFKSDFSVTRPGFWIRYSMASCSGLTVLTAPQGEFGTDGSSYGNYEKCAWKIQIPGNHKRVRLHFTSLDLEYGRRSCPYDKVMVYDGSDNKAPLKGTFCGKKHPKRIASTGTTIFVTFSSDYSITGSGFRIRYALVAGGCSRLNVLTAQSGSFGTSGSHYENNEMCSWKIQVAGIKRVHLHFYRFDLEYGSNNCPYDKMKIYDGAAASAPLIGTFCGDRVPTSLVSTGNTIFVTFASDSTVTKSGFRIWYSAVSPGTVDLLIHDNPGGGPGRDYQHRQLDEDGRHRDGIRVSPLDR